jgi:hypothetical protein
MDDRPAEGTGGTGGRSRPAEGAGDA